MTNPNGFPIELRTGKAIDNEGGILAWAHPADIEESALQQLYGVAELPGLYGLRVMPDVHWGNGATVGSVIAMEQALAPAAVGVDIGCLDAETEVLTPNGWVDISKWQGEAIMIYNPEDDTSWFSNPTDYITLPCDEFFWFKNSKGMNQMVSEEHRMLVFSGYKGRGYQSSVMNPEDLSSLGLGSGYHSTKASFHSSMPDINIPDSWIQMEVMVQADGRVRQTSKGNRVELHFRRERKIERAREILDAAQIQYSVREESTGSTRIAFTAPYEYATKSLSRYWVASERQLSIIAEESLLWDGHMGYRSFYSSTDKESIDLIQYAFSATGNRASISNVGKQKEHHNDVYVVTPTQNEYVGYCEPQMVSSVDGRKYCFVVETGFFIARRGGHIFTTGNCGVNAVRTSLYLEDLDDKDLSNLRKKFENLVPVGNGPGGQHSVAGRQLTYLGGLGAETSRFLDSIKNIQTDLTQTKKNGEVVRSDSDIRTTAAHQLGSLGGGNHFIELTTDSENRIWITLHSGSRNIGKTLAEKHIEIAKKDPRNADLPDHLRDLSLFYKETPEMGAYLHDLNWAQEFAMRSRTVMMENIKHEIQAYFGRRSLGYATPVEYDEEINCHHNYVAEEIIDGRNMIVTRKGAISAKKGELALIPGSMATGSYIVRGLGNPLGFQSASHGAGRKMSRMAAKRTFTVEQLEESMKGIEARTDAGVLDEITFAYKDLDSVIAAESDLVEVVQKLDTILCVKG